MFRLVTLVGVLIIGFSVGIWYDRYLMSGECQAGVGEWTGTICLGSDLLQ